MAQSAADSAAIAGIMSIFDGTNTTGTHAFSTGGPFNCTTTDVRTPCMYAAKNAFGATAADTVTIDFPTTAPGVNLAGSFATNLVRATVSRNVDTTLMRMITPTSFTTVTATATAAIVDVFAPIPIIVLHPTLNDAFQLQGTPNITICGGPTKSIQVNSGNTTEASHIQGSANIDLSHAGPKDTLGDCTLGTGADVGVFGQPSTPPSGNLTLGVGKYIQPASPIRDPLASVNPPPVPAAAAAQTSLSAGVTSGGVTCPASAGVKGCTVWSPGLYPSGIAATNTTMLMKPGIYYMQTGGFSCAANCNITTVPGLDGAGGTNTGWDGTKAGGGVMVYNVTGPINIGSNGSAYMIGSPAASAYKGILFFEARNAPANISPPIKNANSLGGGGDMTLIGTLYFTNTLATTTATPAHYQELRISGNSGSATKIEGEIIADSLTLGGGGAIVMNLNPAATLIVPQVALVQ